MWAARRLASPESDLVALKTARVDLAANPEFERLFVDEASIASRIVHPNVCAIREIGTDQGVAYFVMEWIHGGTLHDILAASPTRRIDCYVAAKIAASVCSGLHAAHELLDEGGSPLHVVHRDVSPQNILISSEGRVAIADFGVARAKGQLHTPTQTGELKGKLSYMAPEQLTTRQFDRRADVFALGCVLYQATTGQRPFHGDDTLETMYRLLETDCPKPSTLVPDYPLRLETIVLTALAKDITTRYQTAAEFEDELLRFLAARGKLATELDVAELVQTSIGEKLRLQAARLDSALDSTSPSSSPPSRGSEARRAVRPFRATTQWTIVGTLALSLTATASLISNRSRRNAPASGSSSARGPIEPLPAAMVEIEIATDPPGGWLRIDAAPSVQSPWHLDTVPSTDSHVVTAGQTGYQDQREIIVFDRTAKYLIRLSPAESDRSDTGTSVHPPVRTDTVARPAAPSASSSPPEWLPPRTRKPKRLLDPENPF